uniref:Protein kinase domain-containing protein n=1 Tax=Amphimedon queenslandica TaxID=400682 RepID=A0A1X7VEA5_AMPQE
MEFELEALLLINVQETGTELGRGAYGVVLEVKVNGTICAAKKLHDLIVQETTLKKFNEEILLHSQQRHPNIVQLIGVYYPPRSQVPMLVMEYLPFTLRYSLEHDGLPLQMKYSILSDVAKGLCYLHGKRPAIVHRDLTANNVLLTPLYSAKISDLGVSRLIDKFKSHQKLTQVPGNAIVMPPEALATKPVYNEKVDVFTYGCLILHVLTCQFPEPTDAFVQYFMFWQSKVAEWDRRSKYIQKIPEDEKELLPLAKQCLQDRPNSRPDMLTVLQAVEEKCTKNDKTLLDEIREKKELIQILTLDYTNTISAKNNEIYETKMELEKISEEKEWCVNELCILKSDMEALKKSEIESKIRMLERENELHKAMKLVLIDREQPFILDFG